MSTSVQSDTNLIDSWANEAVVQFLKDTKINVELAALGVTAGTADYALDDDILSFEDAWLSSSQGIQSSLLQRISSAELQQRRIYEETADVTSMYYALEGVHLLMLYPAPQVTGDLLHIKYVPRPSAMSATSHSPSESLRGAIPEEFHPTLEAYVKWKACESEDHRPSQAGQVFKAEYEQGVSMAKARMNRKSGVMGAPVKWGKPNSYRLPVTPGTDLG